MRILVIDDHPMTSHGLKALFESAYPEASVELFGSIEPLRNSSAQWDIIFLDMHFPGENFADLLVEFHHLLPKTVLISAQPEVHIVEQAKARGVRGLLLKTASPAELLADIQGLFAGERVFNEPQGLNEPGQLAERLTRRQQDVYHCLINGLSNKQIARKLNISEYTVKEHAAAIFTTLGVKSRLELILQEQSKIV